MKTIRQIRQHNAAIRAAVTAERARIVALLRAEASIRKSRAETHLEHGRGDLYSDNMRLWHELTTLADRIELDERQEKRVLETLK